jgi:hypothetical protein
MRDGLWRAAFAVGRELVSTSAASFRLEWGAGATAPLPTPSPVPRAAPTLSPRPRAVRTPSLPAGQPERRPVSSNSHDRLAAERLPRGSRPATLEELERKNRELAQRLVEVEARATEKVERMMRELSRARSQAERLVQLEDRLLKSEAARAEAQARIESLTETLREIRAYAADSPRGPSRAPGTPRNP